MSGFFHAWQFGGAQPHLRSAAERPLGAELPDLFAIEMSP